MMNNHYLNYLFFKNLNFFYLSKYVLRLSGEKLKQRDCCENSRQRNYDEPIIISFQHYVTFEKCREKPKIAILSKKFKKKMQILQRNG